MADRIFPNTFQEEPLDSDLVFKGIDWDNFNTKLAEVQNGLHTAELPAEFREVLAEKMSDEVKKKLNKNKPSEEDTDDLSDVPPQFLKNVKKKKKMHEDDESDEEESEEHDEDKKDHDKKDHDDEDKKDHDDDDDEEDEKPKKKKSTAGYASKMKTASTIVFTHPSQLSAEAVEAAIASGDQKLANTILAARHERRVKLASQIETRIAEETDKNQRLAQRKQYRENLVAKVASQEKTVKTASTRKSSDEFVKVSNLDSSAKRSFASKAIAEGFPKEYVDAILGNNIVVADNTVEIRKVMASTLAPSIKKSAVSSMVKTATLTNADYSRLIKYWKEELGYGDQEWIDALFTKKYD
jgi:hypothetical protein